MSEGLAKTTLKKPPEGNEAEMSVQRVNKLMVRSEKPCRKTVRSLQLLH
jgi:hypothetical protein